MASKVKMAKYQKLQERIIAEIAQGIHPVGDKLPSCREMAKNFKVSYLTVISAMRGLEERGYVQRAPGSGIFVSDPKSRCSTTSAHAGKSVGALIPLLGDLFQNFAELFLDTLELRDHHLVPLPTKGLVGKRQVENRDAIIADLAERGFEAIVIEGTRHIPYKLLRKYENGFNNLTFVIHYESKVDFPASNIVTCDYTRVGELAAEKLFEAGAAKIAMLTFEPLSEMKIRLNGTTRFTHESRIIDAMESVFDAAGVAFNENFDLIIDETSTGANKDTTKNKIIGAIRNGFDGFFCLGDHRAQSVYQAAAELGMRIGTDINVLGMYDTKWASAFSPSLSSISVNEREIAKIAAELITSRTYGERVLVQPEIVTHASRLIPPMSSNRLGCSPVAHLSSPSSCQPVPHTY